MSDCDDELAVAIVGRRFDRRDGALELVLGLSQMEQNRISIHDATSLTDSHGSNPAVLPDEINGDQSTTAIRLATNELSGLKFPTFGVWDRWSENPVTTGTLFNGVHGPPTGDVLVEKPHEDRRLVHLLIQRA